jgi:hypothetical protein
MVGTRIGYVMIVLMVMIVRMIVNVAVLMAMARLVRMGCVVVMMYGSARRRSTRAYSLDMVVVAALRCPHLMLETENL